jgi:hypothetical protein
MDTESETPSGFPLWGVNKQVFIAFFIRACDSGRADRASNRPEDLLTTVTDEIVRLIPQNPTPHYANPSLWGYLTKPVNCANPSLRSLSDLFAVFKFRTMAIVGPERSAVADQAWDPR